MFDVNSFNIFTLGCKVNQYDSSSLRSFLLSKGMSFSDDDFDLAIINSCVVTKIAISKCQKLVNRIKREHPNSKIVLIGCWPRVYNDLLIDDIGVDMIWLGDSDKWQSLFNKLKSNFNLLLSHKKKDEMINNIIGRKKYFIKVQDGCQQFCSYCVIPFSRGCLKSRSIASIVKEFKLAIDNGYSDFVISGIHLGMYGHDKASSLYELLSRLVKIKNLNSISLSSIEINELNDNILDLFISQPKVLLANFHIPLQSGSDKILKLMNRPYNKKTFIKLINNIYQKIAHANISTDLIVGFPGESEKDFLDSYNLVKKLAFSKVHVFSFSAHEKAVASKFKNQVDIKTIKERSKKIRSIFDS